MYQSVPSLTIPRATPGDSHILTAQGVSPNFLCPGDQGFELEKVPTVLKEKYRNFSICFKETGGSLKSRCSCVVSYQLKKTVDVYFIFNNRPFPTFTPQGVTSTSFVRGCGGTLLEN